LEGAVPVEGAGPCAAGAGPVWRGLSLLEEVGLVRRGLALWRGLALMEGVGPVWRGLALCGGGWPCGGGGWP
jgi:hypothetical protein